MEPIRVVFRMYHDNFTAYPDVVALFPDTPYDYGLTDLILCYEHIGQHGCADYHHVLRHSRPATPEEYESLQQELESIGYTLKIAKRR